MRPVSQFVAQSDKIAVCLLLLVFVSGLICCIRTFVAPTAEESSRREMLRAQRVRHSRAWTIAQQHLQRFPLDVPGLALAADVAVTQRHHHEALQLLARLPSDGGRWEFRREYGIGRQEIVFGKLQSAESHLRRALQINPWHLDAHENLGHILQVEGRVWEASAHFFVQILRGRCNIDELLCIATAENFFRREERLERAAGHHSAPDFLMSLAKARLLLYENKSDEAEELLRMVLAKRPDLAEAQGRLGRIIVDRGDFSEFLQWQRNLPDEARDHPEVWFVQGLKARQLGLHVGGVRCFLEVIRRQPNHLNANVQLANCLEHVGRSDEAAELARRVKVMSEIEADLSLVREGIDAALIAKLVPLLGQAGRYWEAAGWAYILTRLDIPQELPRRELRRWLWTAHREYVANATEHSLVSSLRIEDFPTPPWPTPQERSPGTKRSQTAGSPMHFVDDAEPAGIQFAYYEGTSEENRLQHIFNVMGGGLGVLDYDLDGWPDVYLAQAHDWADHQPQSTFRDRLFRNHEGIRFGDVTNLASINELSFSHGVTVGDYNQDGFADVYVGNKGPNHLFRNNGDGTFEEVGEHAGVAGDEWSTSSVFADFTQDGLPDLCVLNYTKIAETTEMICRDSSGNPKSCTPRQLPPEPDKLYVNRGDGTFWDVSESSGIHVPEGRGLGLVVWDFSGDGLLDLFVANDTSADFLWINQGMGASGSPVFLDEAIVRGVAFNSEGHATASMGVAAGDADGDGQIELFITNFFAESNTMFSLQNGGFFAERSREADLRAASFWMLGFGCQFADLDGDGWEDLIVTNGHVDQKSSRGDSDRLPPQIFQNQKGRGFAEVPGSSLGTFFQGAYLGRGLAKLDWNRDGRTDVGISHLHAPFALLTNRSPQPGGYVSVRLIGRASCREPTGAKVSVTGDHLRITRFLTAGDGFLVTNERIMSFAVPDEQESVHIEVNWPSGNSQFFDNVQLGQEILIVEGAPEIKSTKKFAK